MKKQYKVFLLVATVTLLLAMATIVGFASVEKPYVVSGTEYATFADAYAAAEADGTITLNSDVTWSSTFTLDKSVIIDGNGYSIAAVGALFDYSSQSATVR